MSSDHRLSSNAPHPGSQRQPRGLPRDHSRGYALGYGVHESNSHSGRRERVSDVSTQPSQSTRRPSSCQDTPDQRDNYSDGPDRTSSLPPSSDFTDGVESDGEDENSKTYRKLLLSANRELREARKRSRSSDDLSSPTTLARGYSRLVHLFMDIDMLMVYSDEYEEEKESVDDASMDEEELKEWQRKKRANRGNRLLPRLIHNWHELVDNVSPDELDKWLGQLTKSANNARSVDANRAREKVAQWCNEDFENPPNPPLNPTNRDNRGIQNDFCGWLLCPIELDWEDRRVRAKIRNKEPGYELGVTARALYEGYSGDPSDLEKGFLRSRLLLKMFRAIFTSPSSADSLPAQSDTENASPPNAYRRTSKQRKPVRKNVAARLRMDNKVTPRSIAYTAVQLLFALSNASSWVSSHDGLDFSDCYDYIVDYFEDAEDDTSQASTKELLKWWNSQIFPDANVPKPNARNDDARNRLAAQRAARAQALADRN
ncbi:hypothetical protein CC2G_000020 [Coprinopsis cinerea AmutBmut pab1-1]|nr:hypothetical protein CC2G_000020 [Coprinopsis cinerea AmutBmut pab1-1]